MRTVVLKDTDRFSFSSLFPLLFFFLLSVAFFGCKTPPKPEEQKLEEVNPLALLSNESNVYVSVPVQQHKQLCRDIICEEIDSISKDDAEKLVNQLNMLYTGMNIENHIPEIQLAASGSFPSIIVKAILTEKNGWTKNEYVSPSTEEALALKYPNKFSFFTRKDMDNSLSLPSNGIVCFTKNIKPMLDLYAVRPLYEANEVTEWITKQSDDILFYIKKPGKYVTDIIPLPIMKGCTSIYGRIKNYKSKKYPDSYTGDYIFECSITLSNSRMMKPMIAMLTLASGLMPATVTQRDATTIDITEVELSESDILKLFKASK